MKVLIIKIGWSEFLDNRIDESISLGDVFRCTPILHLYKNDDVTWLTDIKAIPLLEDNPYIKRVLPYNLTSVLQLQYEYFDIIINLEKVPGICALTDSINAWQKYGFRLNPITGEVAAYHGAQEVLMISKDSKFKRSELNKTFQHFLFELVGKEWKGEEYILGYTPSNREVYEVGLNFHIGPKWPTKQWAYKNWKRLEKKLKSQYSVTWQKGLKNLKEYIEWLNSSKVIVTHDSLGMHLALALNKKVVAIYGPTFSNEVYMYNRGVKILPPINRKCIPCMLPECKYKKKCIDYISVDTVYNEIKKLIKT